MRKGTEFSFCGISEASVHSPAFTMKLWDISVQGDSLQMSLIAFMKLFCRLTQMCVMCVYSLTVQRSTAMIPLLIALERFVIDSQLKLSSLLIINYLEVQHW